jgi:hypothetical protein
MRKYGTPEPVAPVPDDGQPDADAQGINVTAARQDPDTRFGTGEIVHEGEEGD